MEVQVLNKIQVNTNEEAEKKLFTKKTTFEEIQGFIPFDLRLSKLITLKEKKQLFYKNQTKFYPSIIEELEEQIANAQLYKKKEILYSTIKKTNDELMQIDKEEDCIWFPYLPRLLKGNIEPYVHAAQLHKIIKSVKNDYENGYDYTLKKYYTEVQQIFEDVKTNVFKRLDDKEEDYTQYEDFPFEKPLDAFIRNFQVLILYPIEQTLNRIVLSKYCKYKINEIESSVIRPTQEIILPNATTSIYAQQPKQKLKWTGTPSQFGFIMDLLIQGGYFEKPTGSFVKDANFYLEHFKIETTKGTLAKELYENTNSIETKYRNKLIIPHKDKLSKSESMAKVSGK